MKNKLKPLPKKITDDIRSILERCQSGELKHYQSAFHCGTAHCIAGWKAVLDYAKTLKSPAKIIDADFDENYLFHDRVENFLHKKADTFFEGSYAKKKWLLSNKEAYILFQANADFPEQFALLEKLEAGERII